MTSYFTLYCTVIDESADIGEYELYDLHPYFPNQKHLLLRSICSLTIEICFSDITRDIEKSGLNMIQNMLELCHHDIDY